jgi:Fic family protein
MSIPQAKMDIQQRLNDIEIEMREIDAKQASGKLSFSDIQLLDQAWNELDNERDQLERELDEIEQAPLTHEQTEAMMSEAYDAYCEHLEYLGGDEDGYGYDPTDEI